jgi:uncharacterized protein (UPF0261 family)
MTDSAPTPKTIAVLVTLDTKGDEASYLREQLEALGARALLVDVGVIGAPAIAADISREQVAEAGGTPLSELLENPTRQSASPVMNAGATRLLLERIAAGEVHGVLGLGGTQGTSNHTQVMQQLPYGFPKVMVSTVASGDTSAFVGIKDITMMFSVSDILGLNPVTRKILANAAGAAWGMAMSSVTLDMHAGERPVIGMTNLGVLTRGAMHALDLFRDRGYEVIVFHAVGSGGRAMEQMMKEGLIGAVFDYGLGEIPDEIFGGLRAGGTERLTVAGSLGLPQVIVPGGLEHIGLMVEPNTVPERWKDHQLTFHNPIIVAPRLNSAEMVQTAEEICSRLERGGGSGVFLMPTAGTSSYGVEGGPLRDPAADQAFSEAIQAHLPSSFQFEALDAGAEDPAFVEAAVDRLIGLIEARS